MGALVTIDIHEVEEDNPLTSASIEIVSNNGLRKLNGGLNPNGACFREVETTLTSITTSYGRIGCETNAN